MAMTMHAYFSGAFYWVTVAKDSFVVAAHSEATRLVGGIYLRNFMGTDLGARS